MTGKKPILVLFLLLFTLSALPAAPAASGQVIPKVLDIRDRADLVLRITRDRLDGLLPGLMRETGFDMWIITCNEDNPDPVLMTMMPYENWCPITQILVLFDRGPEKGVERINISRTDTQGLFENAWDAAAWDTGKKESQWACLGRIVRERDPKRIGIDTGEVQWAAGGLTAVLKARLEEAVGPVFAARFRSAEPLATLWLETLVDEEIEIMERAAAVSRSIIADMYSNSVVMPGQTTVDDLRFYYWQRVADLGLDVSFSPFVSIRGRIPADAERYGKADKVIRPGDIVHCDVGLKYMRWNSDHQEVAYVLKTGETDVPETFRKMMAEVNRLQDVYRGEFQDRAYRERDPGQRAPQGPRAGDSRARSSIRTLSATSSTNPGRSSDFPWEQVNNPGRGDVRLVPNSCFTAEMSVTVPVPEWGGKEFRLPLEQDVVFTGTGGHLPRRPPDGFPSDPVTAPCNLCPPRTYMYNELHPRAPGLKRVEDGARDGADAFPLSPGRQARRGRHGRRLEGPRPPARPRRRHQGPARGPRRRPGPPGPVRARGQGRRRPPPSEHRHDPRGRRGRGRPLLHDGARRGRAALDPHRSRAGSPSSVS